jgi:hypothetical protein
VNPFAEYLVDALLGECDPKDKAKRHAVGVDVEGEHTSDPKKKDKIAREHEKENPYYYPRTKKPKDKDEALRWITPRAKADIMPGGSLGGTGDSTAIGGGGSAGGV